VAGEPDLTDKDEIEYHGWWTRFIYDGGRVLLMNRRRLLYLGSTVALGVSAGCLGGGDDDANGCDDGGQTGNDDANGGDDNSQAGNDESNGGQNGSEGPVQTGGPAAVAQQLVELTEQGDAEGLRSLLHPESPEVPFDPEVSETFGLEFTELSTEVIEQGSNRAVVKIDVKVEGQARSSEVEFRMAEGEWFIYKLLPGFEDSEGSE